MLPVAQTAQCIPRVRHPATSASQCYTGCGPSLLGGCQVANASLPLLTPRNHPLPPLVHYNQREGQLGNSAWLSRGARVCRSLNPRHRTSVTRGNSG